MTQFQEVEPPQTGPYRPYWEDVRLPRRLDGLELDLTPQQAERVASPRQVALPGPTSGNLGPPRLKCLLQLIIRLPFTRRLR